jgi:class 3 adenylate cyclase
LAAIDREIDNVRAALRWALEAAPTEALRLAGHLGDYWSIHGDPDGLPWLDAALRAAGERAPPGDRARAHFQSAHQLFFRQQHLAVRDATKAALDLYQQAGDHAGISLACSELFFLAALTGDPAGRDAFAEAARRHARLAGDEALLGKIQARLVIALPAGERPQVLEQAAQLLTQAGDYRELADAYNNAAYAALKEDRAAEAITLLNVARPAAEKAGNPVTIMVNLGNIGLANLFIGNFPPAREAFARQLQLCAGHALSYGADEGLAGLAALSAIDGQPEQAARLLGAARAMGYPSADDRPIDERLEREYFAPARARYGSAAWRQAEAAGAALSYEQGRRAVQPVTRAFMFTDIEKSTDLLSAIGDEAWVSVRAWHDRALRGLVFAHAGEEISHTGDGFFVAFPSPTAAVACAVEIQRTLDRQRRQQGYAPAVRIGLHAAPATRTADGYAGRGVHQAARIAELAHGAEIVASADTLAHAAVNVRGGDPRRVKLKGLNEPVEIVTIDWRV